MVRASRRRVFSSRWQHGAKASTAASPPGGARRQRSGGYRRGLFAASPHHDVFELTQQLLSVDGQGKPLHDLPKRQVSASEVFARSATTTSEENLRSAIWGLSERRSRVACC